MKTETVDSLPPHAVISVSIFAALLFAILAAMIFYKPPVRTAAARPEPPTVQQMCEARGQEYVSTSRLRFCIDGEGRMFVPRP
jgi:hypothetical protein